MSEKWFDKLKSDVMAFLENATEDEINRALEEAGYEFYKDIDYPILDLHERLISYKSLGRVTFKRSLRNKFVLSASVNLKGRISFKEMGVSTSDNYGYALAA